MIETHKRAVSVIAAERLTNRRVYKPRKDG